MRISNFEFKSKESALRQAQGWGGERDEKNRGRMSEIKGQSLRGQRSEGSWQQKDTRHFHNCELRIANVSKNSGFRIQNTESSKSEWNSGIMEGWNNGERIVRKKLLFSLPFNPIFHYSTIPIFPIQSSQ